jgi:hypothetical protein
VVCFVFSRPLVGRVSRLCLGEEKKLAWAVLMLMGSKRFKGGERALKYGNVLECG